MKEDYFSQLNDYDAPLCEGQQRMGLVISFFKFKSFDQFYPPPP